MRQLRDESGQSLVAFAVIMGLISLGFLAFALDVGTLFRAKRVAQSAADAAAMAAAEELAAGDTSNEQAAANGVATLNGFNTSLATHPAVVTLSTPSSGNFTGSTYVQATVSMPIHTIFLGAFKSSMAYTSVSATSIAGGAQSSSTCVCLEGTSGTTLNMSNDSKLTASSCGVVDNSSSAGAIEAVGSAAVNALSIGTVSTNWDNSTYINNGGSVTSSTIVQGITNTCAPTMPTAPTYGSCSADPGGAYGTYTWGPSSASGVVCYTGLTVGANGSTCTLNPGTYVISSGELHFESGANGKSNLGGQGVFFYLTGTASLVIDNGANVNLVAGGMNESGGGTAPTVGSYNGILFYQTAADTAAVSIQGGSSTFINGNLYAPGGAISLANGSSATVEGGIVAQSLTMAGGGTLTAVADASEGALTIGNPKQVQ